MPASFLKCVKEKGKVRTLTLKGGKYVRICSINGKTYRGEVKKKKGKKK